MIQTIVTALLFFILRQRVDLLVILLIFFARAKTKKKNIEIFILVLLQT
jgi:cadmium resistance protein CadD (predicted permease)